MIDVGRIRGLGQSGKAFQAARSAAATLAWTRRFGDLGVELTAAYAFLRQWSNSADYDARAHQVTIGIALDY